MIPVEDERVFRTAHRAAEALSRPGAYLSEEAAGGYAVRITADRRRRPPMRLDEGVFAVLTRDPGLKPRPGGGWTTIVRNIEAPRDRAERPGVIDGHRDVADPDGRVVRRTANLGESPVAWLARRKGPNGEPWLSAAEVAAAERLRTDFERAGVIGRLTMSWDAGPRSGATSPRLEPVEQARAAKERIAAALEAVGPGLSQMLERICFFGSPLTTAERDLGLAQRSGKVVLKLALGRLAAHYGHR